MRLFTFRTPWVAMAGALADLFVGLTLYALPARTDLLGYAAPWLPQGWFAAICAVLGILLLLVLEGHLPRAVEPVVTVLAALPLGALAAVAGGAGEIGIGLAFAAPATGLLVSTFLGRPAATERRMAGTHQGYRTRMVLWSWVLTVVLLTLATLDESRAVLTPVRVVLFTTALSLSSVLTTWVLPGRLSGERIIWVHLTVLTLALGVLFSGLHTGAEGLLAVLAVVPAAAVRTLGRRAGYAFLWLSVAVVAVGPVALWALGSPDLLSALWRHVLDIAVLLVANGLSLTSSIRQAQLVRELGESHRRLQLQNEALTAALDHAREMQGLAGRLAAVLDATPDYVMISDLEGNRLYVNEAARRLVTVHPDAAPPAEALSMEEAFPEWSRLRLLEEGIPQALQLGVWRGESALLNAEGREVPVHQVLLAHRDEGGEISYLSSVSRDITEFKQAEAALRESEERFRSAFDHASVGMALFDLNDRPFQTNQALREMLGYTEAELFELGCAAITHPDDVETEQQLQAKVLSGQSHFYHMEKRYIHKNGHLVWGYVAVSLVRDREGAPAYFVGQVQDISDRKHAETQMLHMATHDSLTELYNRRRFQEELERQVAISARHGRQGAVLFLDLDQFKYVNDSLGHAVGDELLKGVAVALRSRLRRSDVIARLGGDEFAVLLDEVPAEVALQVARDLLRGVREQKHMLLGRDVNVTASIGVALFPEHGSTAGELLARADMAMYQAKELGRDAVCLYSPTDITPARMGEKLTWERRIRLALDEGRMALFAQPIVDLSSGEVETHELLLRMVGEDGQLIPPGAFLGIAEQFGLIREIDRWVVERAVRMLAEAHRNGREIALSVNLSGKAFGDPALLSHIEGLLRESQIDPSRLMFELTETAAVGDPNLVIEFVHALRRLGCRFALDDFGAGFSWFDYLKRLPVDVMKIDGSFVRNLDENNIDRHLVRAMVDAARGLGIRTVAECVESHRPVELLRSYGVEYVQGFHVGRPVPLESLIYQEAKS